MSEGSVSEWVDRLRDGDREAAALLWERYFRRLAGLARVRLSDLHGGMADEEDVALSAFDSFFRGAENGRFPQLVDREGLWRLLVTITARKAQKLKRDETRQKRGGGSVLDEAALVAAQLSGEEQAGLVEVPSGDPSPEFAAQVTEECGRLLDLLGEEKLRRVALWKMEGYTHDEIARQLSCATRSVDRSLRLIRTIWEQEDGT